MNNITKNSLKLGMLLLKLSIAGLLLIYAFKHYNLDSYQESLNFKTFSFALGISSILLYLQNILSGIRIYIISKYSGLSISVKSSIKSCFVSSFVSQFVFSFVGGDAAKCWYLHYRGNSLVSLTSILLLDRIIGFVILTLMFILCLIPLSNIVSSHKLFTGLLILCIFCLVLIIGFIGCLFLNKIFTHKIFYPLQNLLQTTIKLFQNYSATFKVIILSFIINFINVIAIYAIGHVYSIDMGLYEYFIVTVPGMLISMVPISIAGWGIRENAIIIGFGLLNINSSHGLAISITFGLASIVSSFHGIAYILQRRSEAKLASSNYLATA